MLAKLLRTLVETTARLVGALLLLALVLPVAVIVYSTTDDFRARLLAWALPELDGRMNGDLTVAGLSGSPLGTLRLHDVGLAWHGEEIVRIPEARVAIDWTGLLVGEGRIARLELDAPRVVFREHPEHGFDWRRALAPLVPLPDPNRPERVRPPVVIEGFSLTGGVLRIEAIERPPIEQDRIDWTARVGFREGEIAFERIAVASGQSRLTASGRVPFRGGWSLDVVVESLHPQDLARYSPPVAESLASLPAARGHLRVSGEGRALALGGQLDWPEAKLEFDARGHPNPFALAQASIDARLEVGELARFLPEAKLAGGLAATLELERGAGPITARLRPVEGGELTIEGTLAVAPEREAKLRFEGRRLDLARLLPERPEWASTLSGKGSLDLRGESRETLAGKLDLTLDGSRLGEVAIRRAALRGALAGDTIELSTLSLASPIGELEARGRLSTDPAGPIDLQAEVAIDDLRPLLALARERGQGRLRARLAFAGRRDAARIESRLELHDYQGRGVTLDEAGLAFVAHGRLAAESDLRFDSARLDTPLGSWQLAGPARLVAARDRIEWRGARFVSGGASLELEGRLARRGAQDFVLTARDLPLIEWASAWPERVPPDLLTSGRLDIDLAIAGSAAAPTVDGAIAIRDLALAGNEIERARATLRFARSEARATLDLAARPEMSLKARARLPYALAWQDAFVARPRGELSLEADGEARDLGILEPFLGGQVDDFGGRGQFHFALSGPLDALEPSGELTATELTGRPRRSGVRVVGGELAIALAVDRFQLRHARATAEGHEASARFHAEGEGPLPALLARYVPSARAGSGDYTTRIEIERWPLIDTRRDRLIASGILTAQGSLEAPRVEGRVEIVEGTLRPNLAFLSSGPPPRDASIEFESEAPAPSGGAAPDVDPEERGAPGAGRGPDLLASLGALELAVDIDVGRSLWIKHERAEVLLAGRAEARKRPGKRLSVEGRIEAQRGFADLQRRRFRLIEGSLELVGGTKIDPILDVLARHKAPEHTIDARLTGTASKPVLTLSSDPALSQEDILAVLLFGRPASELSAEQQTSLGQRAQEMASSLGMTAVGRSVASAIGLDALGLQIDEISNTRASVGAYVGRNIFVALAQEFSGERGQELSIEYEFFPGWSLVGSTTSQGTNSADLVWRIRY